jgi:hypothetical protein
MWFLTPLLRRLVDYRSGWDAQGVMLVSPFLVTLVTLATFLRYLPKSYRLGGLPFVLVFIAVIYSFLVSLINSSPTVAARALLDWLTPVLFGFHLFVNWRDYPSYRQNIQRTFLWGVLVMGAYGVVQFLIAPEWDRLWLKGAMEVGGNSFGNPEPLKIRVWSTVNAPGHFAMIMIPGLLLLFNCSEALCFPAAGFGYLAFLLSSVRSAWGGWFVGLLILINSLKPYRQTRLIITILVIVVCVFTLSTMEPFSNVINSRVQTLSNIEEDNSFQARKYLFQTTIEKALSEGLGQGLGNGNFGDSGILETLLTMGWFGMTFYLGGIILLLFNLLQNSTNRSDPFMSSCKAIGICICVLIPMGNTIVALPGAVFWGFSGMFMAAHKYYQHQGTVGVKRDDTVKLIEQ